MKNPFSVGLADRNAQCGLKFYPNPASTTVTFEYTVNEGGKLRYWIADKLSRSTSQQQQSEAPTRPPLTLVS